MPPHVVKENHNKKLLVMNRFVMVMTLSFIASQLYELLNYSIPVKLKVIDLIFSALLLTSVLVAKYKNP